MKLEDDDLGELMRRANPVTSAIDERTEAELVADLSRVLDGRRAARRAPSRWPWLFVPTAVVAVVLLALVVQSIAPLSPAPKVTAATPPLLEIAPTSQTFGDAMDTALAQLAETPEVVTPGRGAAFEGWYIQTSVDDDGGSVSFIAPERQELTWNADLSGSIRVTAGAAYSPDGGDVNAPTAGTVLNEQSFAAGETPVLFAVEPPSTVDEMRAYLASTNAMSAQADAVDYLDTIRTFLSEWTPTAAQESALLGVIRSLDGVDIAGEVTDRLGREGIAFRAISATAPEFEKLLILDRTTGRILALETIYVGGIAELDIPTPAVVDYIAWE